MSEHNAAPERHGDEIAVVGMSGRFSRAADVEQFWRNIRDGMECVTFFSEEELLEDGGVTEEEVKRPGFVRAKGILEDTAMFDADFFGFSPREAEIMDPQIRHFLETAWSALEHAGYDSEQHDGSIGVFAGGSQSSYMMWGLMVNPHALYALGPMQTNLLTSNGFISTWTSYKMNLRGPSLNVSTACSTSLVAIHVACQSLLGGECSLALAGGVGISAPVKTGYQYDEGGIYSDDGHTRSFDAKAKGTVSGSGLGVVVLKRFDDALADGDTVYAVIKGSALNNDGSLKIGYTAPSVDGQAEVIAEAQAIASVDPATVTMVECHGSATPLGDPIEVAALTQAYADSGAAPRSVAIGSIKSNLGHLDSGAGIAGFLKTVQALRHKQLPPSLNFDTPNPQIDFDAGPFYVNTELRPWEPGEGVPRRAGVSSFGIGGTNAHIVLEEAPELEPTEDRPWQLVVLSARTATALDRATANLVSHLRADAGANLADVAYTLQVGRRAMRHRRAVVARDAADAAAALAAMNPGRVASSSGDVEERPVAFIFPGDGAQHAGMGRDLYEQEEAYREAIDRVAEAARPLLGLDLRELLFPDGDDAVAEANDRLRGPALGLPALFATGYALARFWAARGVEPQAVAGHDVGEITAACVAGIFSLEDATALAVERGRLVEQLSPGAMLVVARGEADVKPALQGDAMVWAVEGPAFTLVSGSTAAIDATEAKLKEAGIDAHRQALPHAPTPAELDAAARAFATRVARAERSAPEVPLASTATGRWISPSEAQDAEHWARQMRGTIRFGDALRELLREGDRAILEVGPGMMLTGLARSHPDRAPAQPVIPSMQRAFGDSDRAAVLNALGQLWLAGLRIDWQVLHEGERRRRVPLPTYPFERRRYWIDAPGAAPAAGDEKEAAAAKARAAAEADAKKRHPRPNLQNEFVEPRSDTERAIAAIWEELFGIEPIGVFDNFFELGGHSLLGTQVVTRVRSTLSTDIPVRVLFEGPTIAQLAEAVESGGVTDDEDAIQRVEEEDPDALLERLDDLSEEEMEALLQELSAGEDAV